MSLPDALVENVQVALLTEWMLAPGMAKTGHVELPAATATNMTRASILAVLAWLEENGPSEGQLLAGERAIEHEFRYPPVRQSEIWRAMLAQLRKEWEG